MTLDPDGCLITANPAAEALLGVSPGGGIGRPLVELLEPAGSEQSRELSSLLLHVPIAEGAHRFEVALSGESDVTRWIVLLITPAGDPPGTTVWLDDVKTCGERDVDFGHGTPQYRDYIVVNKTLERVEGEIKAKYTTGVLGDIERAMGTLDDVLANWSVARARDNAWATAQTIHALRDTGFVLKQFMLGLGRNVGFAGRSLLVRTEM